MVLVRPSDFTQEDDWSAWYDDVHIPGTGKAAGARLVAPLQGADRPPRGLPAPGLVSSPTGRSLIGRKAFRPCRASRTSTSTISTTAPRDWPHCWPPLTTS